jgi:rubrerythrin
MSGFAEDLSVIIAGRNEEWHAQTVEDVLAHAHSDVEVICILDGGWPPNRGIQDDMRVKVVKTTMPIGQRAATNLGASMSRAKYIMKLDAHCRVDDGFDVKMMAKMQPEYTATPAMYRLHAYDWACNECGHCEYQGSQPDKCPTCSANNWYKLLRWEPKWKVGSTVSWRLDNTLHFQYWNDHKKRPEVQEQIKSGVVETMTCIGCAFMMERERFWELGGMDEGHGGMAGWGQYGCELALKAWLSGGKMVTLTDTWIAHLFRTGNFSQNGESTFPYPLSGADQERAREYSRNLWFNNRWDKQVRPLSWLVEKFWPIPGWDEEDLESQKANELNTTSRLVKV